MRLLRFPQLVVRSDFDWGPTKLPIFPHNDPYRGTIPHSCQQGRQDFLGKTLEDGSDSNGRSAGRRE